MEVVVLCKIVELLVRLLWWILLVVGEVILGRFCYDWKMLEILFLSHL